MPRVINAPRAKLPASAIAMRVPSTPRASPPKGNSFSWVPSIRRAASSSAIPMPIWMLRRGQPATTPAPAAARGIQRHGGGMSPTNDGIVNRTGEEGGKPNADVRRPGDQRVGHHPPQLEDGSGGGERADTQGVEEVDNDADDVEERPP